MEEIIREGKWICPNCNQKNTGSNIQCPACGAARGTVPFIYEEDGEVITDEIAKKEALSGADWICGYCSTSNPAGKTNCKQCGGGKDAGKDREQKDLSMGAPESPPDSSQKSPAAVAKPLPGCFKFGCLGVILFLLIMMGLECRTTESLFEVTGLVWSRSIKVEEFQAVQKSDWKDRVPLAASMVSQTQKERSQRQVKIGEQDVNESYSEKVKVGTRKVKTGVKDLGNGRFKETYSDEPVYENKTRTRRVRKPIYRSDPIYDTWVTFRVNEWRPIDEKRSSGTVEEPKWPDTGASERPADRLGERRNAARGEMYKVTFKASDGTEYKDIEKIGETKIGADLFLKLRPKTKWKAFVSGLGNIKSIEPAK
ncbi:MAG: zinc ribbon domain-containing protein [Candidatus Ozemobacteraceae bacterium]